MSKKYQNIFFLFGLAVLIVMVTQLDFREVWAGLKHAGYWFFAVVALWLPLYLINTLTWMLIIRSQSGARKGEIGFFWLAKVTISGFALNYATPGGLMGGEPYRIMELAPKIGTERATSSVLLYVMTHIFSHFWFWLLGVALFILTQHVSPFMAILLSAVTAFCVLSIAFFIAGYHKGFTMKALSITRHLPFVKDRATRFIEKRRTQIEDIDRQVASLERQNPKTLVTVVSLELACRILSALEIYFIMLVIHPDVNYIQCILILAFTSLFANMLFFIPLQLGGREGGFLMSVSGLGLTANAGIFVALLVRIRELIWTSIGLLLIKLKSNNAGKETRQP